jgi:ABC-type polar amino acid transport system ATPase subunit
MVFFIDFGQSMSTAKHVTLVMYLVGSNNFCFQNYFLFNYTTIKINMRRKVTKLKKKMKSSTKGTLTNIIKKL